MTSKIRGILLFGGLATVLVGTGININPVVNTSLLGIGMVALFAAIIGGGGC